MHRCEWHLRSRENEGANDWRDGTDNGRRLWLPGELPDDDGARGALVPLAAGFRLRGIEARWGFCVMLRGSW